MFFLHGQNCLFCVRARVFFPQTQTVKGSRCVNPGSLLCSEECYLFRIELNQFHTKCQENLHPSFHRIESIIIDLIQTFSNKDILIFIFESSDLVN